MGEFVLRKELLVVDVPGRVLVLYRSKIDLQTFSDAAIPFYRLCAEFGLGFFCGFRTRLLKCQREKCRYRRPCYDCPRNFRMAGRHVAFKALPALSKRCATKRCAKIILIYSQYFLTSGSTGAIRYTVMS